MPPAHLLPADCAGGNLCKGHPPLSPAHAATIWSGHSVQQGRCAVCTPPAGEEIQLVHLRFQLFDPPPRRPVRAAGVLLPQPARLPTALLLTAKLHGVCSGCVGHLFTPVHAAGALCRLRTSCWGRGPADPSHQSGGNSSSNDNMGGKAWEG